MFGDRLDLRVDDRRLAIDQLLRNDLGSAAESSACATEGKRCGGGREQGSERNHAASVTRGV